MRARSLFFSTALIGLSALVATAACSSDGGDTDSQGSGGGGGTTGSGASGGTTSTANYGPAEGVSITKVAMFQALERVLMENGQATDSDIPLVAGRESVVRVHYTTDGYDGGEVLARLFLDDGEPLETFVTLRSESSQEDLGSTINFSIPTDRLGDSLSWRVELLQEGGQGNAVFPAEGTQNVAVDGAYQKLRVVLAPFRYNADGSGRVPNTGEEQAERIRRRILSWYPVSDVDMRVREPEDFDQVLVGSPQSQQDQFGWFNFGIATQGLRARDGEGADAYYYGIINPAASFGEYCGFGCLLGVTLLNNDPPDVGNPSLRVAIGVGYEDYAADTAAHELGHSHGREHAPCGPGLAAGSVDPQFPHNNGAIGVWGWLLDENRLRGPAAPDMMGYCEDPHISDYTYKALLARGRNINQPSVVGGPFEYDIIGIDGFGNAQYASRMTQRVPVQGQGVEVALVGDDTTAVRGEFFRYDHLPGGWLLVPADDSASRVEFTLGDKFFVAER